MAFLSDPLLLLSTAAGILALLFAAGTALGLRRLKITHAKTAEISAIIQAGARSYLSRQYKVLTVFVIVVAAILSLAIGLPNGPAFILGAVLSILAGNIGMRVATASNARTAQACVTSIHAGLRTAFGSGAVMGMVVVGLGLLGVLAGLALFGSPQILFSFGFGASSVALFARVGGGIYTKGADVGADLVGKVEQGIPEDDPRNPAVIADLVGDNVGDVAGMGADLFESYVQSLIAAMILGAAFFASSAHALLLPPAIAAAGILAALIGSFAVRGKNPQGALNRGIYLAAILFVIFSYGLVTFFAIPNSLSVFGAILAGLIAGVVIGKATEFYTSAKNRPTRAIADASTTGPATIIIIGLAVGMESTIIPVLAVVGAVLAAFALAGVYGIAIAAVGMLSTLGITLATDTYGPVADNAAGIAEMSHLGADIRARAEELDAVGNTTAAIGKGFAIGSAALTALALFVVYGQTAGLSILSLTQPAVVAGLFIGGLLPLVFSSLTMRAVGKTAFKMVQEVRRQFREIKGLMEGKAQPDYTRCVQISTSAAIRQMLLPGLLVVVVPVIVGFAMGKAALGGLLAGSTVTGFMLAVMMANSGGAWDNAKKHIEAGAHGGKGSPAHKAAVVGDTVGDPFKDTSGPSLNILIKLVSVIALLVAPLLLF